MPDFTHILPPEIVVKILNYLDQKTCIQCTRVCHHWFNLVPQCTTSLWNELNISPSSWWKTNTTLLQFLGTHVKKVIINNKETWAVLQRLKRHECSIQSLVIFHHVHSPEFIQDVIKNTTILPSFAPLEVFTNTLTELTVDHQQYHISLMALLDTLPLLTHLTVKYSMGYYGSHHTINEDSSPNYGSNSNSSKLVLLCLDNAFTFSNWIHPILRRSPELKFLLISNFNNEFIYDQVYMSQIQKTIQLCPTIQYISTRKLDADFRAHGKKLERRWIRMSKQRATGDKNSNNSCSIKMLEKEESEKDGWENIDNKEEGLRELEFSGTINHEQLISILKRSQHTLEHLHLSSIFARQLQLLLEEVEALHFPRLKSIELVTLEVFTGNPAWIYKGLFDMHHQQLEHLYLSFADLDGSDDFLQESIENMIEATSRLKKLRYLFLDFQHQCTVYCNNLELLSYNNVELRSITLIDIPISDQGLLELCKLPQLHTLQLWGYNVHRRLTQDGFIAFASMLKEIKSQIKLLDLDCDHTSAVTDTVLEHLGQVGSLKTLCISNNHLITDEGTNLFSGTHKELEVRACNLVSQNNPNVLFV